MQFILPYNIPVSAGAQKTPPVRLLGGRAAEFSSAKSLTVEATVEAGAES
jgi:hypothetical protein